jgi:hypothetical protein
MSYFVGNDKHKEADDRINSYNPDPNSVKDITDAKGNQIVITQYSDPDRGFENAAKVTGKFQSNTNDIPYGETSVKDRVFDHRDKDQK